MNPQGNDTHEFTIYSRILGKSAPAPIFLAILLALTPFLDVSLGGLTGLIKLAIWVLAGVIYVGNFVSSGEKVSYINVAFNAAILAGIATLVGELAFWIATSVQGYGSSSVTASSVITPVVQGAIVGAIVAVAWLFYKTNQKA
jgi:hypothetical protein